MKTRSLNSLKIFFILLFIIFSGNIFQAQEKSEKVFPESINFNGYLTDIEGKVFPDANYDFTFSIYTSRESDKPVWTEVHKNIAVHQGEFQVYLGRGTDAIPLNLPFDRTYYLGVKVNNAPEMEQRLEFVSSPYSLSAKIAETVPDNSLTGNKFAPESITNEKIKNISLRKITNIPPGIGNIDKLKGYASIQGSDYEWWTTFGNLIWGPERHFLGTRNPRNFVIGTHEIQRMLFDPYGYIVIGTAEDSVNFEVIGKTTFVDGYIKGDLGVGIDPAEAKMHINVPGINGPGIDPLRIDFQGSTIFNINEEGRVEITSSLSGSDDDINNYTLNIVGVNQGIAIRVDGSANGDNNYMSFWDDGGMVGRIEGQTALEYLAEPGNIATDVYLAALVAAEIVAAVSFLYPLPVPTEPADIISIAANIAEKTFVIGWELGHLGVTYESGGGDYAEWLEKEHHDEIISAGDIIGIKGGRISKNTNDSEYYASISTSPIVLGNMPQEKNKSDFEKVAFLGQVPVKVIGVVKEGDYIIPSGLNDGVGIAVSPELMTSDEFRKVVGRAWTSSYSKDIKYVNTFVGNDERYATQLLKRKHVTEESYSNYDVYVNELDVVNELTEKVNNKSMRILNILNSAFKSSINLSDIEIIK